MPIYEYRCKKCGNVFELRRSFEEMDKRTSCTKCKSRAVARVPNMSFAFVGSSEGDLGDFDFGDELDHDHGMGDDDDFDMSEVGF